MQTGAALGGKIPKIYHFVTFWGHDFGSFGFFLKKNGHWLEFCLKNGEIWAKLGQHCNGKPNMFLVTKVLIFPPKYPPPPDGLDVPPNNFKTGGFVLGCPIDTSRTQRLTFNMYTHTHMYIIYTLCIIMHNIHYSARFLRPPCGALQNLQGVGEKFWLSMK